MSAGSMDCSDKSQRFELSADFGQVLRLGRHQGQPPDRLQQSHQRHRGLNRNGIRFHEIDFHQREILPLQVARRRKIIFQARLSEASHFGGDFVRGHGDYSAPAECNQRQRDGIITRDDAEPFGHLLHDGGHLADVARGLFDAHDVIYLGESFERGRLHVYTCSPLYAIDHHREGHGRGDSLEVLVETFLGRLVVIGRDREDAVHAHVLELFGQLDHLRRVVPTGAGQDRHTPLGLRQRNLDHPQVLGAREGGVLARGAAGHEEVDSRLDLAPHEAAQRLFVEREILPEWSNQRGSASPEHSRLLVRWGRPARSPPGGLEGPALCSTQLNKTSRNSKNPFLPITQRAAFSAPRAKPSRLRAVWRSVMVSAGESNPISCVPGRAPARFELTSIGRAYPALFISSTSLSSVPDGASFLAAWWISHAQAPYSGWSASRRAASDATRRKTFTPAE